MKNIQLTELCLLQSKIVDVKFELNEINKLITPLKNKVLILLGRLHTIAQLQTKTPNLIYEDKEITRTLASFNKQIILLNRRKYELDSKYLTFNTRRTNMLRAKKLLDLLT